MNSINLQNEAVFFTTHQTDSMFILTSSHLKGYGRKDIKIEINEDGSRMTISGDQKGNMQQMIKGFHKTFIIPQGVVLDKVKAKFDQEQARLTIRMPKLVKGVVTDPPTAGIQEDPLISNITSSDQQKHHHKDQNVPDEEEIIRQDQPKPEQSQQADDEAKKQIEKSSLPVNTPVIVGSTLFLTLIVALFGFIRSKNESTKKTN